MITEYLVEAYRRLERIAAREAYGGGVYDALSFVRDVETAVADIQLFGTPTQVELVQEFAIEFSKRRTGVSMDAILRDLRKELRRELGLSAVPDKVYHLRLTPKGADDPKIVAR